MNLEEALKYCDDILDSPLSELEKAVLRGAWENDTYGNIAEKAYADEGHTKNVGSELWKQLSEKLDRKVSKKNIRSILENLKPIPEDNPVRSSLYAKLRPWFDSLDYKFEDYEVRDDRGFQWILRIQGRRRFERILVRGVEGEAGLHDLSALARSVDQENTDEGWLVAVRRMSPAVREQAENDTNYRDRLFCYTLDELVDEVADFSPYIEWLESEIKQRLIAELYVPIGSKKDEVEPGTGYKLGIARYDETEGWTEGYLDRWLDDPAKEHISILGEFGTGKTWLVMHYAWELLQKYIEAKDRGLERPRLPLVIQLRDYAKALDVENVLAGFFFTKHNIRLTAEIFDRLNHMGKLLLIFDGFDEMAARVDKQKMANNFWELARTIVPGAKAILTCRTEHFPDAKAAWEALKGEFPASMTRYVTAEPPQFEILELEPFDEKQIRTVLGKRSTQTETVERVLQNPQLRDLARRPVMTELILEALPEIEQGKPIDISRVYLYAVSRKMERDIANGRTFTCLADKLYFLCELSWEMLSTDRMSLNYRDFPDRIRNLFGPLVLKQKELDHWHYDMMGQTMLIRNADGDYSPAHRSLLEFFVAYKMAAELGVLAKDFTALARQQSCVDETLEPQTYTWSDYFRCEAEDGKRKPMAGLIEFTGEDWTHLQQRWGQEPWAKAVLELLVSMVSKEEAAICRLQQLVLATRGKDVLEVKFLGGNVATLLIKCDNFSLMGLNLSNSILQQADLVRAWLNQTDFKNSNLEDTKFLWSFGDPLTVAFSPKGQLLATGHLGGTIWFWNIQTGEAIDVWQAHTDNIRSIVFSPDGLQLASGSSDSTIKVWKVSSGECLHALVGHQDLVRSIAFSPDGLQLASGSADHTVKLWEVSSGECFRILFGHQSWIRSVVFSPNGVQLASGSDDRTIKLWQIGHGKCLYTLAGHKNDVRSVAFSPDGSQVASGSNDCTLRLWEVSSGQCLRVFTGHQKGVSSVVFSPDGTQLVSGSNDCTIKLWQVSSGECVATLEGHQNEVRSVAFSPNGSQLVSGSSDQTIKLWQVSSAQCLNTFAGHQNEVRSVAFSPNGGQVASGGSDQTVKLWQINNGKCLYTLKGHKNGVLSVAFSPDGQNLASGSYDRNIELWQVKTGQHIMTLEGHHNWVRLVTFSPNGALLASGSEDRSIKLWQISNGKCLISLEGHHNGVLSVAFSPCSTLLASSSSDQTIKLWQVSSGECLATLEGHSSGIKSVVFSPSGKYLASGSDDATIKLWNIANGQCIQTLADHQAGIRSVKFAPDGNHLVSSSDDHTIKQWNISNGQCLRTLAGHQSWVRSVAFSPDSTFLASGSLDATIRIWDVATGECVKVLDDRPYAGLNITGAIGLTEAQKVSLRALGAVENSPPRQH